MKNITRSNRFTREKEEFLEIQITKDACKNNTPLAVGSITSNLESIDLIRPNRLKLSLNNERSPEEPVVIASPTSIIKDN